MRNVSVSSLRYHTDGTSLNIVPRIPALLASYPGTSQRRGEIGRKLRLNG